MVYLNNPICNSFLIFPATCNKFETEISQLKTGKSVGPSSSPVGILKMPKTYISKPLSTGIVPSDFKIANITYLYSKTVRLIKFLGKKQSPI